MKLASVAISAVAGLSFFLIPSCNPEDPSAASENQKILAEAMAKNIALEKEITELKTELEESRAKISQSDSAKMPAQAEIEGKLDQEGTRLKEVARKEFPSSKVESFGTWDLNIPSFERPFSCKAKLVLREANGKLQTLYWTGSADMKGEWMFTKAENLEPAKIEVAVQPPHSDTGSGTGSKPEIAGKSDPVEVPVFKKKPAKPEPPPVLEKPKPKYDIPLDKPVMGPGAR